MIQGLDIKSIKKHPSLIPLFVVLGAGCAAAVTYTARLAFKNPDVSWTPKAKPEPWNDYKNKRYQLLNPAEGKSKAHMERPASIWS